MTDLQDFKTEFGNRKVGFLIRKFEPREDRQRLIATVREAFRERGLMIVDASERTLHRETWGNVKCFLDNCAFGVVIIDGLSPHTTGFNPNVFLEIGHLLALNKDILILIQNNLVDCLPTDLRPFIYKTFDSQDIGKETLRLQIDAWIDDTVDYNPGYLTLYLKNDMISFDSISELKKLALSISYCNIVDTGKLIQPDEATTKNLNIDCSHGVKQITLKTQKKHMAERFRLDFEHEAYVHVPHLSQSILKVESGAIPISEKYSDGGIHYLFNNDEEALVYCQNQGIQDCEKEELYCQELFITKSTMRDSEIELVILPKFDQRNAYLYISNYLRDRRLHPVKMCHYAKTSSRTVLPLSAVDILFLVVHGYMPMPAKLKTNSDYRKTYLDTVNLHLDQVRPSGASPLLKP